MERPFRSPTGWQPYEQHKTPTWQGQGKEAAPSAKDTGRLGAGTGFDRFRGPVYRGPRSETIDAYMREIEQLRRLLNSGDDSWLDGFSKQELIQMRDRARALAGNLSKVQDRLRPFKRS